MILRIVKIAMICIFACLTLLLSCSSSFRGFLLLELAPGSLKNIYFVHFTEAGNQEGIYLLGTIHGRHLKCRSYSLLHLQAVIEHLRPDLVLIESRPEELVRGNWGDGPPEMLFSNLTARSLGIEVKGMDWWNMEDFTPPHINFLSKEREDSMFENITRHLPGHERVLILTGFSHVEDFKRRFLAIGYNKVPFSSTEKHELFDTTGGTLVFPSCMSYYLQKRIEADRINLQNAPNTWWKKRIENGIAFEQKYLKMISEIGERGPCKH